MALTEADCKEIRSLLRGKATNVRCADLERLLIRANWTLAGQRGSHKVWKSAAEARIMLVDHGAGEILPVYVKKTLRAILQSGECRE